MGNPFRYRGPLDGRSGFYNRRSEITRVASRIGAERPQSVSVVAEPRAGKSSLLHYLRDPRTRVDYLAEPERAVVLYLDMGQQAATHPQAFFAQISAAWEVAGGGGFAPGFDGFGDMVKTLMAQGQRLLLLMDDFGLVTQNRDFPLGFFSFMRSVANSNDVGYVTTSTHDLQKLCHTQDIEESPFFNIFTTVHLEPFRDDDARALVLGQAAASGADLGAQAEWIVSLAGGSPYLLQLAGHAAMELRERGRLTWEALLERVCHLGQEHLEDLWSHHMTPAQQEVLRAVHEGIPVARRQEYAAEALERRGHLCRVEQGYRIRAGLTERFVASVGSSLWKRLFG